MGLGGRIGGVGPDPLRADSSLGRTRWARPCWGRTCLADRVEDVLALSWGEPRGARRSAKARTSLGVLVGAGDFAAEARDSAGLCFRGFGGAQQGKLQGFEGLFGEVFVEFGEFEPS